MTQYIAPRTKLFSHLPTLQAIREGKKPPPINVEIDLSNRCSLGCSFCHFAYTHTRGPLAGKRDKPHDAIAGGDLMDSLLARIILEQLHEAGVKSVTWTGGGEPTLHPSFGGIVLAAKELGFDQGLYTHGGHIDSERAMLLKAVCKWVYISLDECTPDSYKRTKGVDRFGAATDGIRYLVRAEGKADIGVGFIVHKDNHKDIHAMVRLAKELGATYVQFRPAIAYSQDNPGKMIEEDTAWLRDACGRLNAYQHDPFVIADIERFREYANWQGHGYPTCYWSALQTVITPNGKVWRCTNKREHPEALLGDLSVESFEELWQRSGGACQVNAACRLMCRGHFSNTTLNNVLLTDVAHVNFP